MARRRPGRERSAPRLAFVVLLPLVSLLVLWESTLRPAIYSSIDYQGQVYLIHGRPKDALPCFRRLVRLDPRRYRGYWDCAIAEEQLGLTGQAIADYTSTLRILTTRDGMLELQRDLESNTLFKLQMRTIIGSLHYDRAMLEAQAGMPSDAVRDCSACLGLVPHADLARWQRARSYLQIHRPDLALGDADILVAGRPYSPDRRAFRAEIENALGRHALADADNREAELLSNPAPAKTEVVAMRRPHARSLARLPIALEHKTIGF